jgi:hypothetical protein
MEKREGAWTLREMGSNRVGGMGEGPALQAGNKASSWSPAEEGATSSWSSKKDGKKSQAWQRGPIMHRVHNYCEWLPFLYVNGISVPWHCIYLIVLFALFQENKSYGNKPFAFILWSTALSHLAQVKTDDQQCVLLVDLIVALAPHQATESFFLFRCSDSGRILSINLTLWHIMVHRQTV